MTRFVLTYDDIQRWLINFLDLDMRITAYDATCGKFLITTSPIGIRKLLPEGYLNYEQYFHIDSFNETSVTIDILGINGTDIILNGLLVKYVNYCYSIEIMELIKNGKVRLHLNKITMLHDVALHGLEFSQDGVIFDFKENQEISKTLRMIQMFLRAGYKHVRVIPKDMGYTGYWFSDDALDYTLKMETHPADIRLWSSFYVPEWLGLSESQKQDLCRPSYPLEQIYYEYGNVTVVLPVTIAEPEIDERTIERNCSRMRSEIAPLLCEVIYNSPDVMIFKNSSCY